MVAEVYIRDSKKGFRSFSLGSMYALEPLLTVSERLRPPKVVELAQQPLQKSAICVISSAKL